MSTAATIRTTSNYALAGLPIEGAHLPALCALLIFAADVVGLRLTLWASLGNSPIGRYAVPGGWLHLWPLIPVFLVLYWFFDLYPGVSVCPVDEIRCIFLANASVFIFVSVLIASHSKRPITQVVCLLACIVASLVELLVRTAVRKTGSHFAWWGYPVVLFGCGTIACQVLRKLNNQPNLGLRPVAVITDQAADLTMDRVPVYDFASLDRIVSNGVRHAIVAAPELSQSEFAEVMERCGNSFPHLILIPDSDSVWKIGSHTRDLTGFLGLQIGNNLLHHESRIAKRTIDLVSASLLVLLLLPLMAFISVLVLVESGFPVFYFQKRLGHGGRTFRIWKFRTMVQNSQEVLEEYLENSSELQEEWARNQKLRNDPRITRVGRFLRKTSLDELPQLWNVVRGEMSLVGPRPIVDAEVAKYQEAYSLYSKATPGLTGLWQVSGRNRTTYEERVAYDTYYVRNWSVWMDLYLLAKTVGVVLTGDGAY